MSKTKKIIAAAVFVLLVVGALFAWMALKPKAVEGGKTIEVLVTHGDGSEKLFSIRTDAESLRAALDQESLVSGEDGEFGLYILTVDGETVDEAKQQWWNVTQSGEMLMTGVDGIMIADGDRYEITFTTGW